jgi:hypothetical protein
MRGNLGVNNILHFVLVPQNYLNSYLTSSVSEVLILYWIWILL